MDPAWNVMQTSISTQAIAVATNVVRIAPAATKAPV